MAYHQAGQCDAATTATDRAVELGYGIASIVYYRQASCHAVAGQTAKALGVLRKAVAAGYETPEAITRDPAWTALKSTKEFLDIIGQPDVTGMNRPSGLSADLDILQREILRKGFQVHRTMTPSDVQSAIRGIKDRLDRASDVDVVLQVMRLLRNVDDGHTGVIGWGHRPEWNESLPVLFYLFEEGVYIVAADPAHKDLVGAQVLEFDGRPVDVAIQAVEAVLNRDNEFGLKARAPYFLRRTHLLHALGVVSQPRKVSLTIRDSASIQRSYSLSADASQPEIWNTLPHPSSWEGMSSGGSPLPLYRRNPSTPYWFEHIPAAGLVYFGFNLIRNDRVEPLERFAERLFAFIEQNRVDRLVIDLRWNNGGNASLLAPLIEGLRRSRVNKHGSLFVIIGRRTFSAAQIFATQVERYTSAIFVGEPTGSSPNFIGEEDEITLPYSKLVVNVSDVFYQSSMPTDRRKWIAPLVVALPSFEDYKVGRDLAMERVLSYNSSR